MFRQLPTGRTLLAIITISLILDASPAVAQPMFVVADRQPVARGPIFAVTGKLGSGGTPGVAVASFWIDAVTVFPAAPGGILGEPTSLSVGRNLRDLAAVDLDGDGLDDLIVSDEAGGSRDARLFSFINAAGAFFPPDEIVLETTVIETMRTGNFDGVEPADVATANGRLGTVSIVYGRGLQLVPSANIFLAGTVRDVAAIDFDADGLDDLAVLTTGGDGTSSVTTLRSEEVGFALRPPATQLSVEGTRMVRGDYDGDDVLDLAVIAKGPGNTEYSVRLLLSRRPLPAPGEALFDVESRVFPCPPDTRGNPSRCTLLDVVSADFDRNRADDLAISIPDPGVVAVLPRVLSGTFGDSVYLRLEGSPRGLAAGDVSGDGVEDLIVTEFNRDAISVVVSVLPPRLPAGAACSVADECETAACVDQVCCVDLECSLSARCDITGHQGACTRPLPAGSACDKNADCRSMTCSALAPATGVCLPGMTGEICGGDCDESGAITVDEILIVIRIALGEEELATCPTSDVSGDGRVTVDEVIAAVDLALSGCPAAGL